MASPKQSEMNNKSSAAHAGKIPTPKITKKRHMDIVGGYSKWPWIQKQHKLMQHNLLWKSPLTLSDVGAVALVLTQDS